MSGNVGFRCGVFVTRRPRPATDVLYALWPQRWARLAVAHSDCIDQGQGVRSPIVSAAPQMYVGQSIGAMSFESTRLSLFPSKARIESGMISVGKWAIARRASHVLPIGSPSAQGWCSYTTYIQVGNQQRGSRVSVFNIQNISRQPPRSSGF